MKTEIMTSPLSFYCLYIIIPDQQPLQRSYRLVLPAEPPDRLDGLSRRRDTADVPPPATLLSPRTRMCSVKGIAPTSPTISTWPSSTWASQQSRLPRRCSDMTSANVRQFCGSCSWMPQPKHRTVPLSARRNPFLCAPIIFPLPWRPHWCYSSTRTIEAMVGRGALRHYQDLDSHRNNI